MTIIFIAVLIVMIALNLFMFFVIKRTGDRVNKQVRSYFVKQLEVCDSLYEEMKEQWQTLPVKTKEALSQEKEGLALSQGDSSVLPCTLPDIVETVGVTYENENFLREYKAVKHEIKINKPGTVLAIMKEESQEQEAAFAYEIMEILEIFNFNTLYDISTLSQKNQELVFREVLNEKQQQLMDAYIAEFGDFDAIEFYDFVKELSFSFGSEFYVKTGEQNENFSNLGQNVVTVHDPSIIEGIKILYRNKMYDYSV